VGGVVFLVIVLVASFRYKVHAKSLSQIEMCAGAELIGEITQYEDQYRLCYIRGPEGIIIALAEQLG
jgi:hypothetical protein